MKRRAPSEALLKHKRRWREGWRRRDWKRHHDGVIEMWDGTPGTRPRRSYMRFIGSVTYTGPVDMTELNATERLIGDTAKEIALKSVGDPLNLWPLRQGFGE